MDDQEQSKKELNQNDDPSINSDISSSESHTETSTPVQNSDQIHKIVDQMSESQLHQYESFRRSGFSKANIKKLVNHVLNQACNPNFIIAVGGVAKVFVGEIVTKALEIQKKWGDEGPLLPSHIHESCRVLYEEMPNLKKYKKFFE